MSQIRPTLGKALPEQLPPTAWDSHDLENRAKRSIRRRRLGGGVLAVALLGVLTLVSTTLLPFSGTETPAGDVPSYPLPELDEHQAYLWEVSGESRTDATEQIGKALWRHLDEHHPELEQQTIGKDEGSGIVRTERQLWTALDLEGYYDAGPRTDGSEQVYQQPVYVLGNPEKPGVDIDTGATYEDQILRLSVYPKDGYQPGTADVSGDVQRPPRPEYLAEGCEPYNRDNSSGQTYAHDFSCSDSTTESGEKVLMVKETVTNTDGESDVETNQTVILYREDGTAVAVAMTVITSKKTDPVLDEEELLAIAEAIPDVPVT